MTVYHRRKKWSPTHVCKKPRIYLLQRVVVETEENSFGTIGLMLEPALKITEIMG